MRLLRRLIRLQRNRSNRAARAVSRAQAPARVRFGRNHAHHGRYQYGITLSAKATAKIDRVVLNKFLGFPLFLLTIYLLFLLIFKLGAPMVTFLEVAIEHTGDWITANWQYLPAALIQHPLSADFYSLLVDGILGGVVGVMIFLPNIVLLYLGISILEDSKYLERITLLMDGIMSKIGLPGKSFIPMILGFGCSLPAIMATKILEKRSDRLKTILMIPLISCGGKLPIYTLIISAFFH
ncbi:MAG: ferrous iron transporter B [Oligoflexia bacterium]|nr:ferrous iron transporter B [Oligoflexia bacterium]